VIANYITEAPSNYINCSSRDAGNKLYGEFTLTLKQDIDAALQEEWSGLTKIMVQVYPVVKYLPYVPGTSNQLNLNFRTPTDSTGSLDGSGNVRDFILDRGSSGFFTFIEGNDNVDKTKQAVGNLQNLLGSDLYQ
jgi:hypothetical protein